MLQELRHYSLSLPGTLAVFIFAKVVGQENHCHGSGTRLATQEVELASQECLEDRRMVVGALPERNHRGFANVARTLSVSLFEGDICHRQRSSDSWTTHRSSVAQLRTFAGWLRSLSRAPLAGKELSSLDRSVRDT